MPAQFTYPDGRTIPIPDEGEFFAQYGDAFKNNPTIFRRTGNTIESYNLQSLLTPDEGRGGSTQSRATQLAIQAGIKVDNQGNITGLGKYEFPEAAGFTTKQMNGFDINQIAAGINTPFTPTGETITSIVHPDNPHGVITTSSTRGELTRSPTTAEQAAQFGLTADELMAGQTPVGSGVNPNQYTTSPSGAPQQGVVPQASATPDATQPQVGDIIPGTNLRYEASDIANIANQQPTGQQTQPMSEQTYTVKSGDTLSSIAQKLGVRTSDITGYRSGNPNLIFPNEVLSVNKQVGSPIVSGTTDGTSAPETTLDTLKKNYGLSITPEVYSSNPVKSIKDLVKEVMEATGLPDYKSRIDAIDAEMKSIQKEQEDKITEVNDNPWLSEGLRSKKVTQIQNKYQNLIDGATNRLKLIQDAYDDARQEAQYAASLAVSIYDKERTFQQNQMEFIIEQAQKAVEAGRKAADFDTIIVDAGGRKTLRNSKTGEVIADLGASTTGAGSTELTNKQTSQAIQLSNSLKSHPAYVDIQDIATGIIGVRTGLAQENGFGDITAINAFQRMVDPGATVRSEDVVLIQTASAFIQKVLSDYPIERLAKGSKLPDPVRAQMKKTAEELYNVRATNYNDTVGNQYKSLSEASGIPFEFVGQDFPVNVISEPLTDEDKTNALNLILGGGKTPTIEEDSGGFFDSFLGTFGLKRK